MEPPLRLATLNIEQDKHLDRVENFLRTTRPDIVCLQELMERDIPKIEKALQAQITFAPMTIHQTQSTPGVLGVGTCSRLPIRTSHIYQYYGKEGGLVLHDETSEISRIETTCFVVLVSDIETKDGLVRIATTHLPKSDVGSDTTDSQREAVTNLLARLAPEGDLVLCGDFNAPRGQEIFSTLAARYKDNVPPHYTTSIDGALHKAGPLPFMVDGIFSTPGYAITSVEMKDGISDHCALVADISKPI